MGDGLAVWYPFSNKGPPVDVRKVITSCDRKITGLNKAAGPRMAHHIADIPNIVEIYGTPEYGRALRVESPSLRVLAESAAANPFGALNSVGLNLGHHFPVEEGGGASARRFPPIKKGRGKLFRSRNLVPFFHGGGKRAIEHAGESRSSGSRGGYHR